METDNFELLKEIVGVDGILKTLKEAGEKAGEAKDWERVGKISNFVEALQAEAAQDAFRKNSSPN